MGKIKADTSASKIKQIYSLTPMQEGMLFHSRIDDSSAAYVTQSIFNSDTVLNCNYIKQALVLLTEKYDILKTVILYENLPKARQVILKDKKIEFEFIDLSSADESTVQDGLNEIYKNDVERGFDIQRDSLLRVKYIKCDNTLCKLVFTASHILLDGWCISFVFQDFLHYYNLLNFGKNSEYINELVLEEKKSVIPYSKYINWILKQNMDEAFNYWDQLLSGCDSFAEIPVLTAPENITEQVDKITTRFSVEKSSEILNFSVSNHITASTVISTAWGLVLQKYNNTDDIVYGKVVSGRNVDINGIENMLGMCINTVPVRVNYSEDDTILSLLNKQQYQSMESANYEYCSLAEIQSNTIQGNRLINSLFVFENYYVRDEKENDSENSIDITMEYMREQTNYSINISVNQDEKGLSISVIYNPSKYHKIDMGLLLNKIKKMVEIIISNPQIKPSQIELITDAEKAILAQSNATENEYPKNKNIVELFEEQVLKNPQNTAVVCGTSSITYKKLDSKVNALASKLIHMGVTSGDYVAIMAEKSLEAIIGVCAILKVGAAYVAIDPKYPDSRVKYILNDCSPKVILTHNAETDFTGFPVVDLNEDCICNESTERPINLNTADSSAYVIYTSGTTGKPKGVVVKHSNIINLVCNNNDMGMNSQTAMLQTGQLAFDASTLEIWSVLLHGAQLHVIEESLLLDGSRFKSYIEANKINSMFLTTALFNQFVCQDITIFDSLSHIMFGGEKANDECVKLLKKHKPEVVLENLYGPTETTVFAVYYKVECCNKKIPIGKPANNTKIYIMNNMTLCGVGIPGELCISGDGVSKGYLNRPKLTAEKFIDNIYGAGNIYRTGDLARWLPDGNIEYLDRIDNQVKIRGFRIELNEIENIFLEIDGINNCVVIATSNSAGDKIINAYVVSNNRINQSDIKNELSKTLPNYMIPANIMQIEKIPVNQNGKVDKKALPVIQSSNNENSYVAPRNETEKLLCEIFSEVLSVEKVGIYDNFFSLGGHSLKVAMVSSLIESKLGIKIKLKSVFEAPTAEMLAKIIENSQNVAESHIPIAENKKYYEMSSVEKRMYLVSQIDNTNIAYNINFGFEVDGTLDTARLEFALDSVMKRHEILRTEFLIIDGKPVQKILNDVSPDFEVIKSNGESKYELFKKFVRPFNLEKAPLIRMQYVQAKDKNLLFIDMHHIISDGMSVGIIINEIADFYNTGECKRNIRQYKDFSEWINNRDLSAQKEIWIKKFSGDIPNLDMPLDFLRPQTQSFSGDVVTLKITEKDSNAIKEFAKANSSTEYMIFLSAMMVLLHKYSRQNDIVIGSPINGRVNTDTYDMLGMFVNTLAMRGNITPDEKFSSFLQKIKEECLTAFDNQEYPFEALVEQLNLKRDLARNPLFDIMLVMQNNEIPNVSLNNTELDLMQQQEIVSKFDITFNIVENSNGFEITSEFCTALYKKSSIVTMTQQFISILRQIILQPDIKIENIQAITDEEKNQILYEFNNTFSEYPTDKTVIEIFEEQAKKTPDSIAVIYNEKSLTYSELNKKANKLAYKLREIGVKPNDRIAIATNRSLEMMVGIYGIIKSGAAYVPIDPNYPSQRIKYIFEDCEPKAFLYYGEKIVVDETVPLLNIEEFMDDEGIVENPVRVNTPHDLLYLIFTSGTTGRPKGVMCHHTGCINRIMWMNSRYPLYENDRILQKTTFTFDVSVWEIFWWCFVGATVVMLDNGDEKNPLSICDVISKNKISAIHFVPSMLKAFLLSIENKMQSAELLHSLKYVFASGEALKSSHVNEFKKYINGAGNKAKLVNLYGPTEASIDVTYYDCDGSESMIPIGRPIANTKLYVMNNNTLCGIGVPGELCITGVGVANGYINCSELTNAKFVKNPYGIGKMYYTGDLARWMPDGNIEYIGRIDEQVKIRGFRIELSEIDNVIREIQYVKDCAVVVKEDWSGENQICAYIISDEQIVPKTIKEELKRTMPDYMIPAFIMQIEAIPVTTNGKLNKRLLPEIQIVHSEECVSPRDEVESNIVKIYKKILNIEKVSVTDNFFDIGGNSLKLVSVFNELDAIYPQKVKISDIFSHPTVESLAYYINNSSKSREKMCSIFGINLYDDYFNQAGSSEGEVLSYEFDSDITDKFDDICGQLQCKIEHIYISVYAYLLSQICTDNSLHLQVFDGVSSTVSQLNISLEETENFFDIISIVSNQLEKVDDENKYKLENFVRQPDMSEKEIVPLFEVLSEQSKSNFSGFDISFEYKHNLELADSLVVNYNSEKLNSEKIYQVFSDYVNIIKMIAKD